MWRWEQGRLEYFQFAQLRRVAELGKLTDLTKATRADMQREVGLPFLPERYAPWRNYSRVYRIAMIVVQKGQGSALTSLGEHLASGDEVTSDEYLHFLAMATSDPSPALSGWDSSADLRYPLLFALRFLFARAIRGIESTRISDIVHSYEDSGFSGDEELRDFLTISDSSVGNRPRPACRQARESLKVLAQLSYMSATGDTIFLSLSPDDAENLFWNMNPIRGDALEDGADEIMRRASHFRSPSLKLQFDYPASVIGNVAEAGFVFNEGIRVRRAHLTIERNRNIRKRYFEKNPDPDCDFCGIRAGRIYPWAPGLHELHHLLPLCSGVRTSNKGTVLEDLVANCPTCHRAVHRYYDMWLRKKSLLDFADACQAREAYDEAKRSFRGDAGR